MSLPVVFGAVGLAFDVGRMYVAKSESQAFCDAAALAAAMELDGTSASLDRANAAVQAQQNRWLFGTNSFANAATEFSLSAGGPWSATPPAPAKGYQFARVTSHVSVPLTMLRMFTGSAGGDVAAQAAAGNVLKSTFRDGVFPYSPFSHNIPGYADVQDWADKFGMKPGNLYTLRWAASPQLHKANVCSGDQSQNMIDAAQAGGGSIRGYIMLNSAADLRNSIVGNATANPPVSFDSTLTMVNMTGGDKNTESDALAVRVNQDTDPYSTTYSKYAGNGLGNGRRVVLVPINGGAPGFLVQGFAAFFLLTPGNYSSVTGNSPVCAEYVGQWTQGIPTSGGTESTSGGVNVVRLFQ